MREWGRLNVRMIESRETRDAVVDKSRAALFTVRTGSVRDSDGVGSGSGTGWHTKYTVSGTGVSDCRLLRFILTG